ncbi:hypothetical protein H0H81_000417 [Sphagnurus paluster]|uniref:RING-type domain-containing protein n=1 Tax=Sphagnurus paluster TaxID=117069 RepID=A0A9P7FU51_9AGAR|nr:hypothetical protein H0H81_000417 [Sphagnurus paluster]
MLFLPDEAHRFDPKYCTLCDAYFSSKALLQRHMESSERHPRCNACQRSFLNKNSLRNHYVISSKHHYCRPCDKLFETRGGLRVHLQQSSFHSDDSDDEGEDDRLPTGWEDEEAKRQDEVERRCLTEEPLVVDDADAKALSSIQRRFKMMKFMERRRNEAHKPASEPRLSHTYSCPVCLSCPKTLSATRCGHLFCSPCIERAVETNGVCPSCRKPSVMAHIRKVDLGVY